jgi:SP family facilitated glucose transporter-like MFS transporter 3
LHKMGWHISALNVIQAVLTCKSSLSDPGGILDDYLVPCIPMNDSTFSMVTSMLTVGGLVGSLCGSFIMARYGRKGALCISHGLFATGSAIMNGANGVTPFVFGRWAKS